MLRTVRFFSCLALAGALAGVAALSAGPSQAQAPQDKPPKLIESKKRLKGDERKRFNDLLKGNQTYEQQDDALIQAAAEDLIYPLT